MCAHKLSVQIPSVETTIETNSLAELVKQRNIKMLKLAESLELNYRTAQTRIEKPETFTLKELMALAKLLGVSESQLYALIRDEYKSRPAAPTSAADKSPTN